METIYILLVLIGSVFLFKGLLRAKKIWRNVSSEYRSKWFVILALMIFFLFGYLLFDVVLFFNIPLPLELVTSLVFLGGAVFVFIIINLSQSTISAQQKTEENIKLINESLELRVAERTKELKRLFDFNRVVLDSIVDAISIIDTTSFRIVDANLAFIKEVNLPKEQIIGRTCYEVTHQRSSPCTPPHDSCPLIETISNEDHAAAQHTHWTLAGEKRYVEIITSPIKDEHGNIVQAVHIQRDITERKRAEEEKQTLEQQIQQAQKLESLGVLAGGIAHDFNNILTIISGNCYLAKMDSDNSEIYLPNIEKASERAAELCRQMLAYAGETQTAHSQIDIVDLVDEMVKMLRTTLPQNAVIKQGKSINIPFIKADASQISQIVMNLIINASEAIGEVQGEIRVSLTKTTLKADQPVKDHQGKAITPGWYVCLEVTDNGSGMNDEAKQRLFEPFYTTKFIGRGLGMSAVRGIILSHGGALQLSSQQGQGTTFKVYLPVQISEPVEIESTQKVSSGLWQGSGTILLVEDDEQVMSIARTMLRELGFFVIEASNGKDALELYQQNAVDITLVMTDMGMPVMDGYELFSELKKLKPELPILISSGFGDVEITSKIARDEITGLISKPYRFDLLQETVKSVMEGAQLKQALTC
jgi:PAS domain S-box-containing protein